MNRTDLADPSSGILATLEQNHPLAVFERGSNGGSASFELEAKPAGPMLEITGGELLGHWTAQTQVLSGRLCGGDGSTTPIEAIGAMVRGARNGAEEEGGGERREVADAATADPATLRRCIAICREDFGLLMIVAACDSTCRNHGDETVAGMLAEPDGTLTTFDQVLLSTEYGQDRCQRRATLELRHHDGRGDHLLRGAGMAVATAEIEMPGARSTLAFFEWSIGGLPAIGRYEIIRAV